MEYDSLREVILPELAVMPDSQLERALERYGVDAELAEGFFSDLGSAFGSIAKAALPIAKVALPAVGGIAGTFLGGPVGAAVGSKLGQLAGGAIGGLGGAPSAPTATPGAPAAGRLLQTITRPETMQAISSMLMGQLGRPNVQVGSTPVPVGAFSNLLGILANQAASEYAAATSAPSEAVPEYMRDYAGEAIGDPAIAQNRAEALYGLLENTSIEQESSETGEAAEYADFESEMEAAEREYEMMDLVDWY